MRAVTTSSGYILRIDPGVLFTTEVITTGGKEETLASFILCARLLTKDVEILWAATVTIHTLQALSTVRVLGTLLILSLMQAYSSGDFPYSLMCEAFLLLSAVLVFSTSRESIVHTSVIPREAHILEASEICLLFL